MINLQKNCTRTEKRKTKISKNQFKQKQIKTKFKPKHPIKTKKQKKTFVKKKESNILTKRIDLPRL